MKYFKGKHKRNIDVFPPFLAHLWGFFLSLHVSKQAVIFNPIGELGKLRHEEMAWLTSVGEKLPSKIIQLLLEFTTLNLSLERKYKNIMTQR